MFRDFIDLFFPRLCLVCSRNLFHQESIICIKCLFEIPKTDFHLFEDNPVAGLFWGRVNIQNATAYYYYKKGSKFQSLIHKMKYQDQPQIGRILGVKLGHQLCESVLYQDIDIVVPVPLNQKKEKKRGYNQSQAIAEEVAKILDIECVSNILFRHSDTPSQTNRSRYDRFENVNLMFGLRSKSYFQEKHVLLVDDVITTGSTLEACACCLLEVPGTKVSAATLAVA